MAYSLPGKNKHHVEAGNRREGQEHLVILMQGWKFGKVVQPKQVIWRQAEEDDQHEADVLHLSPELLVSPCGRTVLFDHEVQNGCKHTAHDARHNYCTNRQKNVTRKHRSFFELVPKVEAFAVGFVDVCPVMIQGHRADDQHHGPYGDAERHGMETPIELDLLYFFKVIHKVNGEDDDVDDEDHVHVNVDHAADHFTEKHMQVPGLSHIVVDAERDGEQEEDVDQDQVEKGDGGPRAQVRFQHTEHQSHADASYCEHRAVDDDQGESVGTAHGNIAGRIFFCS